jgi:peptidoglycan/xylan/chitin deacetylase (PgdA/CDA1 family)
MKRLFIKTTLSFLALTGLISQYLILPQVAQAAGPNLIANSSVESSDPSNPNSPTGWSQGNWGANTAAFEYVNGTGHSGTRNLKVSLTSATSGDAKWYFTPVSITPGAKYSFSDYYFANIPSRVVVQITLSSGTFQYIDLGQLPSAANWQASSLTFTAPAQASQATVFHLIDQVGSLQTDDYSLSLADSPPPPPPPPTITNGVPNSSVETPSNDPAIPAAWFMGQWGTNTAKFEYLSGVAHSGNRSVKVTLSSISSGDVKWYFTPQPIKENSGYTFSDYYQSDVSTSLMAQVKLVSGSFQYLFLGTLVSSASWQLASASFKTPPGSSEVTIFHILNSVGSLTTDDFSLLATPIKSLSQGMVSLTFDDGTATAYRNGVPLLEKYGIKATHYLITDPLIYPGDPYYMTAAQARDLSAKGHEIGSHTVTHPHLTTLSLANVDKELSDSKTYLTNLLGKVPANFATPYGEYNATVLTEIKKYYSSHRSVDVGYNDPASFDRYNIHTQNIERTITVATVKSWIDYARANKIWLVIVFHEIANIRDQYSYTPTNLEAVLQYLKSTAVKTVTVQDGLFLMQNASVQP